MCDDVYFLAPCHLRYLFDLTGKFQSAGFNGCSRLLFSVTDNGTGFDPEKRPTASDGHFGLQGIQDRVDGLDGEMTVRSHPGKGTKVSIALKLRNVK